MPLRFLAAALLLLGACASFASKADYRAYRAVALAEDDRARTLATRDYVTAHPEGRWFTELNAERDAAERPLFEGAGDASDLRFYLEAYPEGRYASQARTRLSALSSVAESRSSEDQTRRGVLASRAAEAAEARRLWGSRAVSYWTRILLGVERWGSPLGEVAAGNEDFDEAFGSPPRPRCARPAAPPRPRSRRRRCAAPPGRKAARARRPRRRARPCARRCRLRA